VAPNGADGQVSMPDGAMHASAEFLLLHLPLLFRDSEQLALLRIDVDWNGNKKSLLAD